MRYTVVTSEVSVIGPIWMPGVTAAMDYTLSGYDVENIRDRGDGEITREAVSEWIDLQSGDFQWIEDFRANIADGDTDHVFDWVIPDNEMTYVDCMYGGDE